VLIAAQSAGGSSYLPLLMILLLFGVMYFMMIRPQQRRRREAQQMQASLGAGDEIVTIGGLYGTVIEADDEAVTLEIAPGVRTRYARGAVARVVTSSAAATSEVESPVQSERAD
jgi:preprotein translocase subunit YajC